MKKLILYVTFLSLSLSSFNSIGQSIETLEVERLYDQSIIIPAQCSPEDMIIVINSSIQGLKFESNILPDTAFQVINLKEANQYIICHEKTRFKLTVSGENLQSEDISVFNLNETHVYRITSNVLRGTVKFNITPGNATIIFPALNNLPVSSEELFKNNSGRYRINIVKPQYLSIDTIITIPTDTNTIRNYSFTLEPLFAKIKLDLNTEDNVPLEKAPILWIDDRRISLDAIIRPATARKFYDNVVHFELYEDNIIPLPEGNYKIRVEAENYIPYETHVFTERGITRDLSVLMELIYGYLTFITGENGEDASIFLNDQLIGTVPIFEAKARVGGNTIRIEKPGYMTDKPEYRVNVSENTNTDFHVSMKVSRKIVIISEPNGAEIWLNDERIAFTPHSTLIPSGNYIITIKRTGYSSVKHELIDSPYAKQVDTLVFNLKQNHPFNVTSEAQGLNIYFFGLDSLKSIEIDNPRKTPAKVMLPYGEYRVKTTDHMDRLTYKGKIINRPDKSNGKIPSYSRHSFTFLSTSYIDQQNIEASLGRIHIFSGSGLSTSILNMNYMVFENEGTNYETIIPYAFFLNWDWRLGGSMIRNFDMCLIGSAKWTPGASVINDLNFFGFHDAEMFYYFYGIEASTRFSYFNLNLRFGYQNMEGKLKIWNSDENTYLGSDNSISVLSDNIILSVGFTLNGKISQSNNMLRIWNKPLFNQIIDNL